MATRESLGESFQIAVTPPIYQDMASPEQSALDGFPPARPSARNPARNIPSPPAKKIHPVRVLDSGTRIHEGPSSPVRVKNTLDSCIIQASSAQIENYSPYINHSRTPSEEQDHMKGPRNEASVGYNMDRKSLPYRPRQERSLDDQLLREPRLYPLQGQTSHSPRIETPDSRRSHSQQASNSSLEDEHNSSDVHAPLQYHHQYTSEASGIRVLGNGASRMPARRSQSDSPLSVSAQVNHQRPSSKTTVFGGTLPRPSSAYSSSSDLAPRRREPSPQLSPNRYARATSSQGRHSPESRPISYVDLLNVPYPQPSPAPANLDNSLLRTAVGTNASLLSTQKTLEMYRANVKKTNDPAIRYEFAVFMINAAQEAAVNEEGDSGLDGSQTGNASSAESQTQLLREARHILQRLSDRSYPFAQYYLADGYTSGLFSKGRVDNDRAYPLFVAASKHGHAEAGYRAALCYEFGWGTRKDAQKAVQYYRQSASKNHPGAMFRLGNACLKGDLGLDNRSREGLKWMKRAAESADFQYNSAPYELGVLHETGHGDDIFKDESYAAQLFTQAADLGHAEASYRLGDAYEHGTLNCPKDPALSVHFYNGAAQRGHPMAMMALCAWYMVGAEPVLEKDENEAYEWARKAAEYGIAPLVPILIWGIPKSRKPSNMMLNRSSEGRIRRRLVHGNGHGLPARSTRSQHVVRPRRRPR